MKARHTYTIEQHDFIKNNCKGKTSNQLTKLFNEKFELDLSVNRIRNYMQNHKIRNGLDTKFQKGNVKDNGYRFTKDDKRGVPYRFKKGNVSHTIKTVGTIVERTDGYLWKKIKNPDVWKPIHVIIWEKENGNVPDGYVVIFKDMNKKNYELDNLAMISKAQLAMMNRYNLFTSEKELTDIGITISKLILKRADVKRRIEDD